MSSGNDDSRLSADAIYIIRSQIFKYVCGLVVANVVVLLGIFSTVYWTFQSEFRTKFELMSQVFGSKFGILENEYESRLKRLNEDMKAARSTVEQTLKLQNQDELEECKKALGKQFDEDFFRTKLTEVSSTAGKLEQLAKSEEQKVTMATQEAIKMAISATSKSQSAIKIADNATKQAIEAQTSAKSASDKAEATSKEVEGVLTKLKNDENQKVAKSLATLIDLMSKNEKAPLSDLADDIKALKSAVMNQLRLTNSLTVMQQAETAFDISIDPSSGEGASKSVPYSAEVGDYILINACFSADASKGPVYWSIGQRKKDGSESPIQLDTLSNPVQCSAVKTTAGCSTIALFKCLSKGDVEFFVKFQNKSPENTQLSTPSIDLRGLVLEVQTVHNSSLATAIASEFKP